MTNVQVQRDGLTLRGVLEIPRVKINMIWQF